jgi:molybdopterin-guanine dinucleotide biosynthesis protein A
LDIACIILAGGASTRYGREKAIVTIRSETLLQRVLARVPAVCQEVVIVGTQTSAHSCLSGLVNARVVDDIIPGLGPIGGIYTGLRMSKARHNLVVACDMPFLNLRLLQHMIGVSRGYDAVVPRLGNLIEPLHAVYDRNTLGPIEKLLVQGVLMVSRLFDTVPVRYVEREEIERWDPHHLSFFNINTVADLRQARKIEDSETGRLQAGKRAPELRSIFSNSLPRMHQYMRV